MVNAVTAVTAVIIALVVIVHIIGAVLNFVSANNIDDADEKLKQFNGITYYVRRDGKKVAFDLNKPNTTPGKASTVGIMTIIALFFFPFHFIGGSASFIGLITTVLMIVFEVFLLKQQKKNKNHKSEKLPNEVYKLDYRPSRILGTLAQYNSYPHTNTKARQERFKNRNIQATKGVREAIDRLANDKERILARVRELIGDELNGLMNDVIERGDTENIDIKPEHRRILYEKINEYTQELRDSDMIRVSAERVTEMNAVLEDSDNRIKDTANIMKVFIPIDLTMRALFIIVGIGGMISRPGTGGTIIERRESRDSIDSNESF